MDTSRVRHLLGPRPLLLKRLAFFAVVSIVIALSLSIVLRHGGWPLNHDQLSVKDRIGVYASHIRQGDFFPVWSSSDGYGLGTPMPLFYQKLFYYLGAGILLLFHTTMKETILIALAIFFYVGAYGMRKACLLLTSDEIVADAAAVGFLCSNYVFTNWLVRGDVAEFSAMMIVPWLLWWCINLIQNRRFSYSIVFILWFLVLAHNAIAVLSLIPLSITYIIYASKWKRAEIRPAIIKTLKAVGCCLVLIGPLLILELLFAKQYDPSKKIIQDNFNVAYNIQPLSKYFFPSGYSWLKNFPQYTIQIDYAIWIGILAVLAGVGVTMFHKPARTKLIRNLHGLNLYVPLLFVVALAVLLFMQLHVSLHVYDLILPLQWIQFPWRMMTLIVPLAILLLVWLYGKVLVGTKPNILIIFRVLACVWVISIIVLSPVFQHFTYPFFPSAQVNAVSIYKGPGVIMTDGGEYLPKTYVNGKELDFMQMFKLYIDLYNDGQQTKIVQGDCTVIALPAAYFDSISRSFSISCSRPSKVALPISYNDFSTITDKTHHKMIPYSRVDPADPRIVISVPKTQSTILKVDLPTTGQVLKKLL